MTQTQVYYRQLYEREIMKYVRKILGAIVVFVDAIPVK